MGSPGYGTIYSSSVPERRNRIRASTLYIYIYKYKLFLYLRVFSVGFVFLLITLFLFQVKIRRGNFWGYWYKRGEAFTAYGME